LRLLTPAFALGAALLCVQAADAQFAVQTVAGGNQPIEQIPAVLAPLASVEGMAVDAAGNVYLADTPDHRVRRITPQGIITTVAGNGRAGFSGDNGPATSAALQFPYGLTVDRLGNLYIADLGNARVRRVTPEGVITTVAGGGAREVSYFGASLPGREAKLTEPRNVLADEAGNVFITDFGAHRLLRLAGDGTLAHIAGTREPGNAPAVTASLTAPLRSPTALALDRGGSLYIADAGNNAIRRIRNGVIQRVYATGSSPREVFYGAITGMAIDAGGDLYVVDGKERPLRRVSPAGQVAEYPRTGREVAVDMRGNVYLSEGVRVWRYGTFGADLFAGSGGYFYSGDGGLATLARLRSPGAVALDAQGQIWIADTANQCIRRVRTDGRIDTVRSGFPQPTAIAVDRQGIVYVADSSANTITRLQPDGRMDVIASRLARPAGLALDVQGRLYIAESGGGRVLEWTLTGGLREIAVGLRRPVDVAAHPSGDLVILEAGSGCILRRDPRSNVTGQCGLGLNDPAAIAVHSDGSSLIVAEHAANRVVRLDANGSRVVLTGEGELQRPADVAVTATGEVYVADQENHRIVRIAPVIELATNDPPSVRALVSAANLEPAAVAPGALMVVLGNGLGPAVPTRGPTGDGRFLTRLEGWEVRFDALPAPIVDAEESRLMVQVPYGVAGRVRVQVTVFQDGSPVGALSADVAELAPVLYREIRHADGGVNLLANAAAPGSTAILLATGLGEWVNPVADGEWFPDPAMGRPRAECAARMGGLPAEVESMRAVAGMVGLVEVRAKVPDGLIAGSHGVVLTCNGVASPVGVQVWVR
jgi:uncharacterized protein (TIGR03437 family)